MDRIELIQCSLRCFAFGLAGLVPVFGTPFSVLAILEYRTVMLGRGNQWNPAGRYLTAGYLLAGLGLLVSLLIFGLVFAAILHYLSS